MSVPYKEFSLSTLKKMEKMLPKFDDKGTLKAAPATKKSREIGLPVLGCNPRHD